MLRKASVSYEFWVLPHLAKSRTSTSVYARRRLSMCRMNSSASHCNQTTPTSPPPSTEPSSSHGSPQPPPLTITTARPPKYLTRFQSSTPTKPNIPTTTHHQIQDLSSHLLNSLKSNTQIPPLSSTFPSLDLTPDIASKTRNLILNARIHQYNETPVGRKIGFTNRNIWPRYNIREPIWGYVYDSTVFDLTDKDTNDDIPTVDLTAIGNLQPRIEPEIVFGIHDNRDDNINNKSHNKANHITNPPSPPQIANLTSTMPTPTLLEQISWFAPAFEIVISPFQDWKFSDAAETTAAFALHGRLCIGPRVDVAKLVDQIGADAVVGMLADFEVGLYRDGERVEGGVGRNVLGGPVEALRYLVRGLEKEMEAEMEMGGGAWSDVGVDVDVDVRLRGGEVVSTGTLTDAWPIGVGISAAGEEAGGVSTLRKEEIWEMKISGLEGVSSLKCRFVT